MKILLCIAGLPAGGAEKQFLKLAEGLNVKGHDVFVHVFGRKTSVHYKEIFDAKYSFYFSEINSKNKFIIPFKILKELKKVINDFKPDIIYGSLFIASFFIRMAKLLRFRKCKYVTSIRNDFKKSYPLFHKTVEHILYPLSNALITNHFPSYEYFKKIINNKSFYVANGIDKSDINDNIFNKTKSVSKLNILSVGRLVVKHKNQLSLINAINLFHLNYPDYDIHLTFIGYGKDKVLLQNKISELKLDNVITLSNPVFNLSDYYHESDLIIHPSIVEGCPNVVLEAMLHKKIVIASHYIGQLRIIEDKINGLVANDNSGNGIYEKIIEFTNLSNQEKSIIETNAQKTVLEKFSVNYMINNYIKIFQSLIKDEQLI